MLCPAGKQQKWLLQFNFNSSSMDSLMLSRGGVLAVYMAGGVLAVYMAGGVWHISAIENLHPWYFVDQETCHNFFGLKVCLTVKILPCIFLSVKFRVHVLFWVCNMKLHRPSPHVIYTASIPPSPVSHWILWYFFQKFCQGGIFVPPKTMWYVTLPFSRWTSNRNAINTRSWRFLLNQSRENELQIIFNLDHKFLSPFVKFVECNVTMQC